MRDRIVAQLLYDRETDRILFDGDGLYCGECLEVLICNGLNDNKPEWVETRIEKNADWYLVGLIGYQVSGLFARR